MKFQAFKTLRAGLLAGLSVLTTICVGNGPSMAGPASLMVATPATINTPASPIEPVRYRRGWGYGGAGFVLGLAAGAAIGSYGYRSFYSGRPYYGGYYSYHRPVSYRSHRNCWWSHRWHGWVCKRHSW